jgi:hypothetical protein
MFDLRFLLQVSSPIIERTRLLHATRTTDMVSPNPVVRPMTNLERRRTPRTTVTGHAYVNIEPNNGGIVLNVSDGGLCFHSFDPVQRNGNVSFWFSGRDRRIEAQGTLAWSDETQKGGLRFTTLPPEAREHIRQWMLQSATPAAGEGIAPHALPPRAFRRPIDKRADTAMPVDTAPFRTSPESQLTRQLRGFSWGLITGLLVSAVVIAGFLFYNYRREFGESLIRLGEQFAAKPQVQGSVVPGASQAATAASAIASPTPPTQQVALSATPIPAARSEKSSPPPDKPARTPKKMVSPPLPAPAPRQQAKIEPSKPAITAAPTTTAGVTSASAPVLNAAPAISAPAPSRTPLAASSPMPSVSSASNPVPNRSDPAPKVETAKQAEVQTENSIAENGTSTSELYFDVGKFKNQSQAHIQMEKLSQLGFPTTAVQKGFLWTNSYHVLVGPYSDEERAKATHEGLVSSGFKPRPFERGSRPFTLNSPVTLNGTRTPPGDYIISWESSLDDASVKLLHNDLLVASANGRWVRRDVKYPRDAYVYRRNTDGSRTLVEIRFGGTRQALVFGKS